MSESYALFQGEAIVKTSQSSTEIVEYGEGGIGFGDKLEGVGGVEAVVLHALVE